MICATKMRLIGKILLLFAVCVGGALAAETAEMTLTPEILTNEGVVALANAGFSDAFIMEKIRLSDRTRLDVSVQGLSYLRRNAITEKLVLFILKRSADTTAPAASPATPAPVPTVIKAKLKMKKIAVPMESVSVVFMPAGLASNTAPPTLAPLLQPSSYANPVPANPGAVKVSQASATNVSWWQ